MLEHRRTNIFDHCVEVRLHSYFLKKTLSRKMVILVVEQTARRTERERDRSHCTSYSTFFLRAPAHFKYLLS